jgi:L-asparagine transporter-like permease
MFILCQGGCNNDITPVLRFVKNMVNLIKIIGPAILLIIAAYHIISLIIYKAKKKKSKVNHLKRAISSVVVGIVVFAAFALGSVVLDKVIPYEYDKDAQCWCNDK